MGRIILSKTLTCLNVSIGSNRTRILPNLRVKIIINDENNILGVSQLSQVLPRKESISLVSLTIPQDILSNRIHFKDQKIPRTCQSNISMILQFLKMQSNSSKVTESFFNVIVHFVQSSIFL